MERREIRQLQGRLIRWFTQNQRPLPWRERYLPYEIWISEIMLQQTRVDTVVPYYLRWMQRFPGVRSVTRAGQDDLLKHWEGMGYYSRVLNIHRAAGILMDRHGGELPRNYHDLLELPGIGPYTAAAIRSLAFNLDEPLVDGNVERVFSRLFNMEAPVKSRQSQAYIRSMASDILPSGRARCFNQALMELGATVCTPRRPGCLHCPVAPHCESLRLEIVHRRPVPGIRRKIVPVQVVVGIIEQDGKVFIQKRPSRGLMAGLWEFPGGKIENTETPEEALAREMKEELGLRVQCVRKIASIEHNYTSFRVSLHAYACTADPRDGAPALRCASDARWVDPGDLDNYAFPAANRRLIDIIRKNP